MAPIAVPLGDTDELDEAEPELDADATLEVDVLVTGTETEPEGVLEGATLVELVTTSVVVEGNGAVVIGGTGVTLEVSDATEVGTAEDAVPPVMLKIGLMLPESPKTRACVIQHSKS